MRGSTPEGSFPSGEGVCAAARPFPSTQSHPHPFSRIYLRFWRIFFSLADFFGRAGLDDPPSPGSQSGWVLASPRPYPGGVSFGARNSAGDKWPWPHSPRGDWTGRGNFPKGTGGQTPPKPLCAPPAFTAPFASWSCSSRPFVPSRGRQGLLKARLLCLRDLTHPKLAAPNSRQERVPLHPCSLR